MSQALFNIGMFFGALFILYLIGFRGPRRPRGLHIDPENEAFQQAIWEERQRRRYD